MPFVLLGIALGAGILAIREMLKGKTESSSGTDRPNPGAPVAPATTPKAAAQRVKAYMAGHGKDDSSELKKLLLAFQIAANANGYSPRLSEDGVYGPKTEAALTALSA